MIPLEGFTDEDKDGDDDEDESYLVMKVMIVKEVMTGDVSPVAMFFLNFFSKKIILIFLRS